jgi:transcriptional regulator, LysR family
MQCFKAGLGIGVMPSHMAEEAIARGELVELTLADPLLSSPCCIAWRSDKESPPVSWLLNYLGDKEQLQQQWL